MAATARQHSWRLHHDIEAAHWSAVGSFSDGLGSGQTSLPPCWPSVPVEQAEIQVYVRNASELPVVVKQLAYSIHTKWLVPEGKQNWELVAGRLPVPRFFVDDIQVPPRRTWDNNASPYEANLAHTAKAPCGSLSQTVSAARSTGF
jgi:hypothetical protein